MRANQVVSALAGCVVILCLCAVMFADFLPTYGGAYADQRFLLVGLVGFLSCVATIWFLFKAIPSAKLSQHLLPAIAFILGFSVLSLGFVKKNYAFVEAGLYSFYFAAIVFSGLVLAMQGLVHRYIEIFVSVAAGSCFLYGAMSVNVYLFALADGQADLSDLIPWGFVNIRYWSHVATWLLPILPLAVLIGPLREYRLWRSLVAIGAGIWWWIIFLSASRGSIVGVVTGVLIITLCFGRQSWPWLRQFTAYLLLGGMAWLVLSVLVPSLFLGEIELRSVHATSSGRLPLFQEAWQMSLQHFPFGMGPQSWLTHDLLTQEYVESSKFGHPHNMYLMWAAEYGWLLVFLLAVFAVNCTFLFWKRRTALLLEGRTTDIAVLCGVAASVIGALVHAGVSAVFIAPGSMLVGVLVLAGFWALIVPCGLFEVRGIQANPKSSGRLVFTAFLAPLIVLLWLLWLGQVHAYYVDMRTDEIYYKEELKQPTMPRFWLHGNFPRADAP